MVVACESMLTHAYACVPTRGVWAYAPQENFLNFDPLRLFLLQSGAKFSKQYFDDS